MKLLLDTHVWVWSQLEPHRLGARAERALQSPANELWLSPISVWEAVLLGDARRLRFTSDPIAWVHAALLAFPLREAAVTHEIALQSRRVELLHDDPADRFLVATAKVLGLTLVTSDERLLALKQIPVLSSR